MPQLGLSKQIGFIFVTVFLLIPRNCPAQDISNRLDRDASDSFFQEYERKLNAVLKTRRDEEKKFVADIVEQVRLNRIPAKLVVVSWRWARENRPETEYPFIYFEKVLRILATKLELAEFIPVFDYSIYGSAGQKIPGQNGSAGQRTEIQKSGTTRSATNRSSGQIR